MVSSSNSFDKITTTELKQIHNPKGSIGHLLKSTDTSFAGFGEAYLTRVHVNTVKAWKRHNKMIMNLIVLSGVVRFVFYHDQKKYFKSCVIKSEDFKRLTIPPMIWFGFQGLGSTTSTILNLASIVHDPLEVETAPVYTYEYNWEKQ